MMPMQLARPSARIPRRHWSRQARTDFINGLVFTAPAIVGLLWFVVYPVAASLYYSFTAYSVLRSPRWIGLENYRTLLTDEVFHTSLANTLYYVVLAVPIGIVFALALALLLNLKVGGQSIYRAVFYLPSIVPAVASAVT